jgi:predicted dienelactone hydrolase
MRRLSPVDEERDDTVTQQHRRVCELPHDFNSVRLPAASGSYFAKAHAVAEGFTSQLFQVAASNEPRDESGLF